ncbi:MAG TPA: glycosyltransferase family 4 protein [Pirellulales bacterium]|nr:glycosyltransferase family 4 protein [Pirellulales bacterium]
MRVAWLFEYPTLHGGERSLLAAWPALKAAGIRATALAPARGPLNAALIREGIEVVPFETHVAAENVAAEYSAAQRRPALGELRDRLAAALLALRPEVLHANSLAMGRLSGPVATNIGLPSLAHLRDIIKLSRAVIADLNCHMRLLAVSRATREFHVSRGLLADKVRVLYNGVDLGQFQPQPPTGWLNRQLGLPFDSVLIGTIGQLVMRKGHDVLARAAGRLARTHQDVHWIIAGSRHSQKAEAVEYEAGLCRSFIAAGLADHVHFVGELDGVHALLPELTLLVHPARQEPLGRVLLEAAATGVPCVATDVGGTREIFPPEANAARLVPGGDECALADAIAQLLADAAERSRLGQAARRRAEEAFDVRAAAAGLLEVYVALRRVKTE